MQKVYILCKIAQFCRCANFDIIMAFFCAIVPISISLQFFLQLFKFWSKIMCKCKCKCKKKVPIDAKFVTSMHILVNFANFSISVQISIQACIFFTIM